METLKWNVLPHPPYSPDIAPSDYWLFRRHNAAQFGKSPVYFSKIGSPPKTNHFFEMEIRKLPERWEKVVASDEQYFN